QRREARWVVSLLDDQPSVHLVGGRREEPVDQDVLEELRLDAVLADEGERLAHRLDRAAEQEVVRELRRRRRLRPLAGGERPSPDRLEQRRAAGDGVRRAGGNDPEPPFRRDLGSSEDRRGYERLPGPGVCVGDRL